ncbi:histidine kinase [Paenibacillus sp. LHD-117]|uniref:sensor histidine kinase n=1 Tax=Paenibacillus sp. LHD-117 TaxID=3071412 RepID=UPI0027DECA30|nr:histidine kinase [Paenibacillus sp. LHD-117]MDQ6422716.1 histidine kinase [Paenibacillus sp. LHD-117]
MKKKPMLPFGYKLMASYLLMALIPVMIIGYYAYTTSVQSIREQAASSTMGTLQQTKENVLYRLQLLARTTDQLYWDYALQEDLRLKDNGWAIYNTTIKSVEPKLQNAVNLTPQRALLRLYVANEQYPEMYALHKEGTDPLARMESYELLHLSRIQDKIWYNAMPHVEPGDVDETLYWAQVEEDRSVGNMSLLRRMYDYDNRKQIGFIRVVSQIDHLLSGVHYEKLGANSSVLVLNGMNEVIYASSAAMERYPLLKHWQPEWEEGHLSIRQELQEVGWTIVALVPDEQLEKQIGKVKVMTVLICIGSFFMLAAISLVVSRFLTVRIRKIIHSLNAFREGRFNKRIQYSGNDEFYQIAEAFNEMGGYINTLIKEVYVVQMEKKGAELKALQAQINPHFLYNTLSSISRLGKLGEIEKLDQMVMGLAKFYRLTLNNGKMIIGAELEIEQVQAYIAIQKIKYGSRLDVFYDIGAEVYGYRTVKLILQPFIENVLEHALYQPNIQIKVGAHIVEGSLEFRIVDDGIGMKPETIRQIWSDDQSRIGYGIRNVDERIKLHYGAEYGVEIGSVYGGGTTVCITVPLSKKEEPA